jgi:hypothetical protein
LPKLIAAPPILDAFSLAEIARATGLSLAACSRFRAGTRVPHPRHWQAFLALAKGHKPCDSQSSLAETPVKVAEHLYERAVFVLLSCLRVIPLGHVGFELRQVKLGALFLFQVVAVVVNPLMHDAAPAVGAGVGAVVAART